jgi:hypothetical protein
MNHASKTFIALALSLATSFASAVDLGTHGTTWAIDERDLRELIAEDLAKVDVNAINTQLTESANTFFERLPQAGLPAADKTRTRWVDPSIELTEDIKSPVKGEDGEWTWQVLHPKGTKANPLEKLQPPDRMLFFNAESPEEVEFVKQVLKHRPTDVTPVATGGNIKPIFEELERPVFFAKTEILDRFSVKATPSMVGVGSGLFSIYLAITELKLPLPPEVVSHAWFGLTDAQAEELHKNPEKTLAKYKKTNKPASTKKRPLKKKPKN